jgi:hypothetical protein
MKKSSFFVITLLSLLMLSTCSSLVAAQYTSEVTTPVTIDSTGRFYGTAQDIGVGYDIQGTPGSTGSVTAQIYNGNPQSTANVPEGVSLTRFVVITFNMAASDFIQANIFITYTDEDVANLQTPYTLYKYVASTDSFVELPASIDTAAKMVSITVSSIDDPLFAIGGTTALANTDNGFSTTAWALLAASIVIVVLLVVAGVWFFKRSSR